MELLVYPATGFCLGMSEMKVSYKKENNGIKQANLILPPAHAQSSESIFSMKDLSNDFYICILMFNNYILMTSFTLTNLCLQLCVVAVRKCLVVISLGLIQFLEIKIRSVLCHHFFKLYNQLFKCWSLIRRLLPAVRHHAVSDGNKQT